MRTDHLEKSTQMRVKLYTLSEGISSGVKQITLVDASAFSDQGGTGLIGEDSFRWSGKNGERLTGISGIDEDAAEGTVVSYYVQISAYDANRERMGMNDPVPVQFVYYITHLLEGDWGESITYHRPVIDVVKDAAPITLEMSFLALAIALPIRNNSGDHQCGSTGQDVRPFIPIPRYRIRQSAYFSGSRWFCNYSSPQALRIQESVIQFLVLTVVASLSTEGTIQGSHSLRKDSELLSAL